MTRPLVDPRLTVRLTNFLPSTCTVQRAILTTDAWGASVSTWNDHLTAIPCQLAAGKGANYRDTVRDVVVETDRLYLPPNTDITEQDHVTVDGVTYEVQFIGQPLGRGGVYRFADVRAVR